MNNEKYNQIIDEAYESYLEKMVYHPEENWLDDEDGKKTYRQLTQEEFISKCKTDSEFSKKWGLKIEERELSLEERNYSLGQGKAYKGIFGRSGKNDLEYKELFDRENRPTKLLKISGLAFFLSLISFLVSFLVRILGGYSQTSSLAKFSEISLVAFFVFGIVFLSVWFYEYLGQKL